MFTTPEIFFRKIYLKLSNLFPLFYYIIESKQNEIMSDNTYWFNKLLEDSNYKLSKHISKNGMLGFFGLNLGQTNYKFECNLNKEGNIKSFINILSIDPIGKRYYNSVKDVYNKLINNKKIETKFVGNPSHWRL